jgi:catechol 2,3-dioxygenase-like lactoylglutathione lyase family enzyme
MIEGGRTTLFVSDLKRSVRFWTESVGLELVEADATSAIVDAGNGFRIELCAGQRPSSYCSPCIRLYSTTHDEEIATSTFEKRGVGFDLITLARDGTWMARFLDPDDNVAFLCGGP